MKIVVATVPTQRMKKCNYDTFNMAHTIIYCMCTFYGNFNTLSLRNINDNIVLVSVPNLKKIGPQVWVV